MTLIAVLISLFAEHFLGRLQEIRHFRWLIDFSHWTRRRLPQGGVWEGPAGVLVVVGGPVLLVGLFQAALVEPLYGLVGFLFAVVVLLYCLGPKDLDAQVEAFLEACEGEDQATCQRQAKEFAGVDTAADDTARYRGMTEAVFVQASQRIFSVLFWFALLGPVGAVLYRFTAALKDALRDEEDGFATGARRLHDILAWLPARLAAAGYALSGHFEEAVHAWREYHHEAARFPEGTDALLVATGLGALDHNPDTTAESEELEWSSRVVKNAVGLVWRTLVVWVTVIALLTLAGWAG